MSSLSLVPVTPTALTSTPVTPSSLGSALTGFFYNLKDYGAVGDCVTDDTAAINRAFQDAAVRGGCIIVPGGYYKTTGGHNIPAGCELVGCDRSASWFLNVGSTYTFLLSNTASGQFGPGLRNVTVFGSDANNAAVAGAVGVRVGNSLGATVNNVSVYGFSATGAVGLQFYNANSGSFTFTEHADIEAVQAIACATCVQFYSATGAQGSFGYTNMRNLQLGPGAAGTGIDIGGTGAASTVLYNAWIQGSIHYSGNNQIGVNVTANGTVWQGTMLRLCGELNDASGCTRIKNRGFFEATGKFFVANTQPADDLAGGTTDFIEEPYTEAELPAASRTIASAATITVPPGSEYWSVTGTTGITSISASSSARRVTLRFAGILTVTDGSNLRLAGNLTTAADTTLTLICENSVWYEVSRSSN